MFFLLSHYYPCVKCIFFHPQRYFFHTNPFIYRYACMATFSRMVQMMSYLLTQVIFKARRCDILCKGFTQYSTTLSFNTSPPPPPPRPPSYLLSVVLFFPRRTSFQLQPRNHFSSPRLDVASGWRVREKKSNYLLTFTPFSISHTLSECRRPTLTR